ncbi:MAG: ATP-binding protein, partial [Candidatus Eisenbacteria bacterium]
MNAEDAFAPTQDRSHFFASSAANAVLTQLEQGLVHESPITVVTGEALVGKTWVLREACARWGARVRAEWLEAHGTAPDAFLPAMIRAFDGHVSDTSTRSERVAELVRALGRVAESEVTPVLILENTHTLPGEMLAELARIVSAAAAAKSK